MKLALCLERRSALLELHLLSGGLAWTVYAAKETARMMLAVLICGPVQGVEAVVTPWMLISAPIAVATVSLKEELADHHHRRVATETGMDLLLRD